MAFFHRLRPPARVHINEPFSVHLCGSRENSTMNLTVRAKPTGLKIPCTSGRSLLLSCSDPAVYRIPVRRSPLREVWRFLIAHTLVSRRSVWVVRSMEHKARTPRSARLLRLIGNCSRVQPGKHAKTLTGSSH